MKTHLSVTYLLLFIFLSSCKKDDLPHPLIGSWTHNSKTLIKGDFLQTLIFKNNKEGERITVSSPVCSINGELITMTSSSLCYGIGFGDEYFVDDTNHFSW